MIEARVRISTIVEWLGLGVQGLVSSSAFKLSRELLLLRHYMFVLLLFCLLS